MSNLLYVMRSSLGSVNTVWYESLKPLRYLTEVDQDGAQRPIHPIIAVAKVSPPHLPQPLRVTTPKQLHYYDQHSALHEGKHKINMINWLVSKYADNMIE